MCVSFPLLIGLLFNSQAPGTKRKRIQEKVFLPNWVSLSQFTGPMETFSSSGAPALSQPCPPAAAFTQTLISSFSCYCRSAPWLSVQAYRPFPLTHSPLCSQEAYSEAGPSGPLPREAQQQLSPSEEVCILTCFSQTAFLHTFWAPLARAFSGAQIFFP